MVPSFKMPGSPLLLIAKVILVSVMSSVRCPGPALGVVGVSTNTRTGLDTTMSSVNNNCYLSEGLTSLAAKNLVTCMSYGAASGKIFNMSGTLKASIPAYSSGQRVSILKDPLKLFTSCEGSNDRRCYTIQDGGTYVLTVTSSFTGTSSRRQHAAGALRIPERRP